MTLRVEAAHLPGVVLLIPKCFEDDRGYFLEHFRADELRALGVTPTFVQDNQSLSDQNVLRGLHYQWPYAQGKLVSVLRGRVLDVAVDIRRGSKTFGQWAATELSETNHHQLYIPPGFAHGFLALAPQSIVFYKCTEYYRPTCDRSILWSDPDLGIEWPTANPRLSPKDTRAPRLRDVRLDDLPPL